ncbi:MAG: S8 family serine peptidase [Vicinamibacterales bacterium]
MSHFVRKRGAPLLFIAAVVALWASIGDQASTQGRSNRRTIIVNGHEAVEGEVLVRFRGQLSSGERTQIESQIDTEESEAIAPTTRRFRSRSYNVRTLVDYLRTRSDVEVAEPNYLQYALATPNDPYFGTLWGLLNLGQTVNGDPGTAGKDINATQAWDVTTGSRANVVAVVDSGVDYNHPDLAANIWSAPTSFTVTLNGVTITCAAGTHGFNAINNTCNPMDDNNHGTHVSGTIGGVGNNGTGVAGVNWIASIMGAKFLSSSGSGSTSNAIKAIEFTIQAKQKFGAAANVRVLSNSWGGGGYSQLLLDEINKANTNDMLFVAAAGNASTNTDSTPSYPASYSAPNVISVAATTNDDLLASFSNYGATSVDLAAPGVNVRSTIRSNGYAYYNGTSMATPHVSGAAALVLSVCSLTTAQLKDVLLSHGVEAVPALASTVATGGRLDVNAAVRYCSAPPTTPPPAPTGLTATGANGSVTLKWTASSGATSYKLLRGTSAGTYNPTPIATGLTSTSYVDTAVVNGTTYHYAVVATNGVGDSSPSANASATPIAPPSAPTGVTATGGSRQVTISWNPSGGATSYTVRRSTSSGGSYSTVASNLTATTYTNTGLQRNRRYYYIVIAVNAAGSSPNSAVVSALTR